MSNAISWFIPHPANNHHPLALRHKPLTAVSALLIIAKIVAISVLTLTPAEATLSTITTNRIIQLTNDEREKVGLAPLAINSQLTRAAELKANDMFKNQYFAHISPTGVTPWYWMQQTGYSYEIAGENLAIDFTQAEDIVSAWLASPKHKENMLRPEYTQTGVAVVSGQFKGSTSIIVVHMFGEPLATVPPTAEPTPPVSVLLSAKAFPPKLV
ncbi:MAG TPA: CAP domain-containing protein, partial [Candidatus Andersenbacteria bacterium]|nr:CAP domain-containing protein [Candidatus Andersenbacteria bacterium]